MSLFKKLFGFTKKTAKDPVNTQSGKAVAETSEPVAETPEPVAETSEPVAETPGPVTGTPEMILSSAEALTAGFPTSLQFIKKRNRKMKGVKERRIERTRKNRMLARKYSKTNR